MRSRPKLCPIVVKAEACTRGGPVSSNHWISSLSRAIHTDIFLLITVQWFGLAFLYSFCERSIYKTLDRTDKECFLKGMLKKYLKGMLTKYLSQEPCPNHLFMMLFWKRKHVGPFYEAIHRDECNKACLSSLLSCLCSRCSATVKHKYPPHQELPEIMDWSNEAKLVHNLL